MGKKGAPPAAASPTPDDEPKKEEPVSVQLEGDFVFKDGSTYSGQYLKIGEDIFMHGDGELATGPEQFKGLFDNGAYKSGKYTACSGATYEGAFRNGVYHGYGEYNWPDGRAYKGTWKEGYMHGRGAFLNFSFGVDNRYVGFCLDGRYSSNREEQEEMKQTFLSEYFSDYTSSASLALKDLAARASPEGGPKDFFSPAPAAEGEEESPDAAAERASMAELLDGPQVEPAALQQAALQAFAARLEEGAEKPLSPKVYEDRRQAGTCLNMQRLKHQQLQHVGQCVEFSAPDAEPGSLAVVVLINVSREYDVAKAKWKVAHLEEAK
eukprot:TRINITY_DN5863_c0_g1_i1.p1 TRINITY_DN5863_c0_g1~~TRINITY_DN5863_c0_g1_i1.p1  ORF type:complete len:323 (+),score=75.24 TRINITY_DN5863_c0_g1_i1:86-1054(+)